jgi:DNA-binding beta-propeller fold protein YncE
VIYIFDRDGNHLDTLLGPEATLSGLDFKTSGDAYINDPSSNNQQPEQINFLSESGIEQKSAVRTLSAWAPLGVRFDNLGNMLVTDVSLGYHCVHRISLQNQRVSDDQPGYSEQDVIFGTSGSGPGEFMFPNVAVADSQGRIYVSDGNNGRISVWDNEGNFLFHFGLGSGEGFVRLPRGLHIDHRDNLYIVDTVGHDIKVYDVSGSEPHFKFAFGDLGLGDGMFNYPNDIVVDATGRLYIADRENHRVQVWSY